MIVSHGDSTPAFVTLISTTTLKIVKQVTFDGTNGTPDTSQGDIAAVLYGCPGVFRCSRTRTGEADGKESIQ